MELNFNLLKNKTSLITGASRGIGRETAVVFAKNKSNLILLSRSIDELKKLKKQLEVYSIQVDCYEIDITNSEARKNVFIDIRKNHKKIDVLVNNAGIMENNTLQMVKDEVIQKTYNTNVFSLFDITKRISKIMIKNRSGSIINLTSIVGIEGGIGQTIYGSSKSAVLGFTKSLSKELAPLNIRVNGVAPGLIKTSMTENLDLKYYNKIILDIAMGRIGKPQDVAKVILFLASELSEYVTGQIIGVDGGMII